VPESESAAAPYAAFDIVAVAASTGGLEAYRRLLSRLPSGFPAALVAVQHRSPAHDDLTPLLLRRHGALDVESAVHGAPLRLGTIHVAPADRQLVVDGDGRLSLDTPRDGVFPLARCAADPLFASVAAAFGRRAIAVVLSGALNDGASGARAVKRGGGRVLVQDPATAAAAGMPNAAIATGCVDFVLPPEEIAAALVALVMAPGAAQLFRVPVPSWALLA
jgi:two-component system chemotaxis response regulator CheB